MSSGEAGGADLAAVAGAAFAVCVVAAAVGVGAVAALGGAAADLAGDVATFVGTGVAEDFVSTLLAIAGVAATEGDVFVAVGEMALTGGALDGSEAALGSGAFLSVAATGAAGGPAQPETNSANIVAVRPGTSVENIFLKYISSPISVKEMSSGHHRCGLASENSGDQRHCCPHATQLPSPNCCGCQNLVCPPAFFLKPTTLVPATLSFERHNRDNSWLLLH